MANHASLSKRQVSALAKFLELKLGDSVDDLIKEVGVEDAFALTQLKTRLVEKAAEDKG